MTNVDQILQSTFGMTPSMESFKVQQPTLVQKKFNAERYLSAYSYLMTDYYKQIAEEANLRINYMEFKASGEADKTLLQKIKDVGKNLWSMVKVLIGKLLILLEELKAKFRSKVIKAYKMQRSIKKTREMMKLRQKNVDDPAYSDRGQQILEIPLGSWFDFDRALPTDTETYFKKEYTKLEEEINKPSLEDMDMIHKPYGLIKVSLNEASEFFKFCKLVDSTSKADAEKTFEELIKEYTHQKYNKKLNTYDDEKGFNAAKYDLRTVESIEKHERKERQRYEAVGMEYDEPDGRALKGDYKGLPFLSGIFKAALFLEKEQEAFKKKTQMFEAVARKDKKLFESMKGPNAFRKKAFILRLVANSVHNGKKVSNNEELYNVADTVLLTCAKVLHDVTENTKKTDKSIIRVKSHLNRVKNMPVSMIEKASEEELKFIRRFCTRVTSYLELTRKTQDLLMAIAMFHISEILTPMIDFFKPNSKYYKK